MHMNDVQLYDRQNIDTLEWPQSVDGIYAANFLLPMIKNKVSYYIDNIDVDAYVIKVADFVFPVLATTENYTNSWVCSPYAHYIAYGKESLNLVKNPMLASLIGKMLGGLDKISRKSRMNSIVYVNNWMFSTDLYPEGLSQTQIQQVVKVLKKHFPHHAIMWRSLNELTNSHLKKSLSREGFHLIASRYVFVTDTKNAEVFKARVLKSDLKLWKENPYQIVSQDELLPEEYSQLLELYSKLYVIDHSPLQPQFNLHFFKMLLEKKLMQFKILKSSGEIKGIAGYYKRGNVMMCPLFGYEKNNAESNTIYRILNTALLMEAQKQGLLFNQSAGAAFFKSIRRATGCLEYSAVYTKHLPPTRQIFWSTLKFFINKFGSRYMEKY